MDLRQGKCSGEEVAQDGFSWRSISDPISNSPPLPASLYYTMLDYDQGHYSVPPTLHSAAL